MRCARAKPTIRARGPKTLADRQIARPYLAVRYPAQHLSAMHEGRPTARGPCRTRARRRPPGPHDWRGRTRWAWAPRHALQPTRVPYRLPSLVATAHSPRPLARQRPLASCRAAAWHSVRAQHSWGSADAYAATPVLIAALRQASPARQIRGSPGRAAQCHSSVPLCGHDAAYGPAALPRRAPMWLQAPEWTSRDDVCGPNSVAPRRRQTGRPFASAHAGHPRATFRLPTEARGDRRQRRCQTQDRPQAHWPGRDPWCSARGENR